MIWYKYFKQRHVSYVHAMLLIAERGTNSESRISEKVPKYISLSTLFVILKSAHIQVIPV